MAFDPKEILREGEDIDPQTAAAGYRRYGLTAACLDCKLVFPLALCTPLQHEYGPGFGCPKCGKQCTTYPKGHGKTRTANGWMENDQHVIFPTRDYPQDPTCFWARGQMDMPAMAPTSLSHSRFRAAEQYLAKRLAMWIGTGDKQNELEDALAAAYEKGWKDAMESRGRP
jgi:hypothetical protein